MEFDNDTHACMTTGITDSCAATTDSDSAASTAAAADAEKVHTLWNTGS